MSSKAGNEVLGGAWASLVYACMSLAQLAFQCFVLDALGVFMLIHLHAFVHLTPPETLAKPPYSGGGQTPKPLVGLPQTPGITSLQRAGTASEAPPLRDPHF